jgi:hypothetical protein
MNLTMKRFKNKRGNARFIFNQGIQYNMPKRKNPEAIKRKKAERKKGAKAAERKAALDSLLKRKREQYVNFPPSEIGRMVERLLPMVVTKARTYVRDILTSDRVERHDSRWNEAARNLGLLKAKPATAEKFASQIAKKAVAQVMIEPPIRDEVTRVVILEKLLADKEVQQFGPEFKELQKLHEKAISDLKSALNPIMNYILER